MPHFQGQHDAPIEAKLHKEHMELIADAHVKTHNNLADLKRGVADLHAKLDAVLAYTPDRSAPKAGPAPAQPGED